MPSFDPVSHQYGLMPLATKDTIAEGARGDTVTYLQAVLRYGAGQQSVEIDGIFGPLTADAVRSLQALFGLPKTGVVDAATWSAVDYVSASA